LRSRFAAAVYRTAIQEKLDTGLSLQRKWQTGRVLSYSLTVSRRTAFRTFYVGGRRVTLRHQRPVYFDFSRHQSDPTIMVKR
jgi:hypothetical protein